MWMLVLERVGSLYRIAVHEINVSRMDVEFVSSKQNVAGIEVEMEVGPSDLSFFQQ